MDTAPQLVSEAGRGQTVVLAAPRPLSSSTTATTTTATTTTLISPPSHSAATAAARAAKSGNGSGNNTTGILKSGTTSQHHHNSHRATKRAGSNASVNSHHSAHSNNTHASHTTHTTASSTSAHSPGSHSHDNDGRPKRVWKACERCRMKKTKCDGEFPCKRCKDDGLVCTAGTRKKTEYKQIPKGYAEVLENTQVALVATIHKLYAMVQAGQPWTLGEPELNERGQPVIHSIASKLGCIRPNNDPDLPFGSAIFPESDKDLGDLQAQLNDFHKQREAEQAANPEQPSAGIKTEEPTPQQHKQQTPNARKRLSSAKAPPAALLSASAPTAAPSLSISLSNSMAAFDAASASSLEDMDNLSDLEDHRKNMFGRGNRTSSSVQSAGTMSPRSLTFNDFESAATATTGTSQADGITMPTISSPTMASSTLNNWMAQPAGMGLASGMNVLGGLDGLDNLDNLDMDNLDMDSLCGMEHIGVRPDVIRRRQQQQTQPQTPQQILAEQARQQRLANILRSDTAQHYIRQAQQQQQQQHQQQHQHQQHQHQPPYNSPVANLAASTMAMAVTTTSNPSPNPAFFSVDMLAQNMFDYAMKPDMMNTDAMLGSADPMIFDGSFDERMMP